MTAAPRPSPVVDEEFIARFDKRFPTTADAEFYLWRVRYPDGYRCVCGETGYYQSRRRARQCKSCRRDTSLTADTLLHRAHLPLRTWLLAAWLFVHTRTATCTMFREALGVQMAQAYAMLARLRAACENSQAHWMSFGGYVKQSQVSFHLGRIVSYETSAGGVRLCWTFGVAAASIPSSVLRRLSDWLEGVHGSAVQPKQLQSYLDEFAFHTNVRRRRFEWLVAELLKATPR